MKMKQLGLIKAASLCALTLSMPMVAKATPVTWNLSASYTDTVGIAGAFTAFGSFVYDASLGAGGFGAIGINLTDVSSGGNWLLNTLTECGGTDQQGPNGFTFATSSVCAGPAVQVRGLPSVMTDAGGTISIAHSDVSDQSVACSVGCGHVGFAEAGSNITSSAAVPEPTSLLLAGLAVFGLVGSRRRKA